MTTMMMMKRQCEQKQERACKKQRAFGVSSRNGLFYETQGFKSYT